MEMAPKYILEQFIETELLVNITEHMVKILGFCANVYKALCVCVWMGGCVCVCVHLYACKYPYFVVLWCDVRQPLRPAKETVLVCDPVLLLTFYVSSDGKSHVGRHKITCKHVKCI